MSIATTIALAAMVLLLGTVLVRSASPLQSGQTPAAAEACESATCTMTASTDAAERTTEDLPREWQGHRKPYTFDHMYRE